jgi:hypothetical protein
VLPLGTGFSEGESAQISLIIGTFNGISSRISKFETVEEMEISAPSHSSHTLLHDAKALPRGPPLLSDIECDIHLGPVSIINDFVTCGRGTPARSASFVRIYGSSTSNSISIQDSDVIIEFHALSLGSETPFSADASTVSIFFSNANTLTPATESHAGIHCQGDSNLSFASLDGGSLTVESQDAAAAIGVAGGGLCGTLLFQNATVNAIGVTGGTGIGAGSVSSGISKVRNITILDGLIVASGRYGAAIGSGLAGGGSGISAVDRLTILNGTVEATGSNSPGIGAGYGQKSGCDSRVGSLTIVDGNITATATSSAVSEGGAGIGSGTAWNGNSTVGRVTILNGTIRARAWKGAGIGGGFGFKGNSTVFELIIANGNVRTAVMENGAGIGGGSVGAAEGGRAEVHNLSILDGNITAGGTTAGIGSGYPAGNEGVSVGTMSIMNGSLKFVATASGPGITAIGPVTIWNGVFDCTALMIGVDCFSAPLTFANGSTTVIAKSGKVLAPASGARALGSSELHFEYLASSVEENLTGVPLIHLGSIPVPVRTRYLLNITGIDEDTQNFSREVVFDAGRVQGCAFSVGPLGDYTISAESATLGLHVPLSLDGNLSFAVTELSDIVVQAAPAPTVTPLLTPTPPVTPTASHSPLASTVPFTHAYQRWSRGTASSFRWFGCFLLGVSPWGY